MPVSESFYNKVPGMKLTCYRTTETGKKIETNYKHFEAENFKNKKLK